MARRFALRNYGGIIMAKTIKERAHQYGCKAAGGWYKGGMRGSVYEANHDAYIEIATEQQKIDIDKACEWIRQCITFQHPDYRHPVPFFDEEDIESFKRAMEE